MGATSKYGGELEKFTREHVAAEPNLMVYRGKVINIESFKKEHPGGAAYLERWAGKDITNIFNDDAPHKHSPYAENVVDSLVVGSIIGAEQYTAAAQKYQGLVDVDKPFLPQIWALGADYPGWMASQPVVRKLTIFPQTFLEAMSRYPWWWIWFAMPPIILSTFFQAVYRNSVSIPVATTFFGLGLLVWAFMEYMLHRFVFHLEAGTPSSNIFHFFAHGLHHLTPYDETRLTFPPPFTGILALGFYKFFELLCLGHLAFPAMYAGFAAGYLAYDTTHFLYHHTDCKSYGSIKFPRIFASYLQCMKSHHNVHHYLNDDCNYGVSSPLLDHVFGTYLSKKDAELLKEQKSAAH